MVGTSILYFGENFDMLDISSVAQPFVVFLHCEIEISNKL